MVFLVNYALRCNQWFIYSDIFRTIFDYRSLVDQDSLGIRCTFRFATCALFLRVNISYDRAL